MSEGLTDLFVLQMRGYASHMSLDAAFDKMNRTYLGHHSMEMEAARDRIENRNKERATLKAC